MFIKILLTLLFFINPFLLIGQKVKIPGLSRKISQETIIGLTKGIKNYYPKFDTSKINTEKDLNKYPKLKKFRGPENIRNFRQFKNLLNYLNNIVFLRESIKDNIDNKFLKSQTPFDIYYKNINNYNKYISRKELSKILTEIKKSTGKLIIEEKTPIKA
ncbi:hypothetical protein GF385_02385, partial [Candidatus Dependentiae bacterium]|nr:hypothetical protein [Candidatus Dependentiae bacterium]